MIPILFTSLPRSSNKIDVFLLRFQLILTFIARLPFLWRKSNPTCKTRGMFCWSRHTHIESLDSHRELAVCIFKMMTLLFYYKKLSKIQHKLPPTTYFLQKTYLTTLYNKTNCHTKFLYRYVAYCLFICLLFFLLIIFLYHYSVFWHFFIYIVRLPLPGASHVNMWPIWPLPPSPNYVFVSTLCNLSFSGAQIQFISIISYTVTDIFCSAVQKLSPLTSAAVPNRAQNVISLFQIDKHLTF